MDTFKSTKRAYHTGSTVVGLSPNYVNIWSYELCTRIVRTDYGREIFVTELSANGTVHPPLL